MMKRLAKGAIALACMVLIHPANATPVCDIEERSISEPTEREKAWLRSLLAERADGDKKVRSSYIIQSANSIDIADFQSALANAREPEAVELSSRYQVEAQATSSEEKKRSYQLIMNAYDAETWGLLIWITETFGFPSRDRIGAEKAYALVFLQHPPSRMTQQRVACLFRSEVLAGRMPAFAYASMIDKMNMAYGEPLTYGVARKYVDGRIVPVPVDDLERVNKARLEIGLEPRAK